MYSFEDNVLSVESYEKRFRAGLLDADALHHAGTYLKSITFVFQLIHGNIIDDKKFTLSQINNVSNAVRELEVSVFIILIMIAIEGEVKTTSIFSGLI